MTAREDLLAHLWKEVININLRDSSLDNIVAHCKRDPTGPFGDKGPAVERILARGERLPGVDAERAASWCAKR